MRQRNRLVRPMSAGAHRVIGAILLAFALIAAAFGWAMREFILFGGVFLFAAVYLGLHALEFLLTKRD